MDPNDQTQTPNPTPNQPTNNQVGGTVSSAPAQPGTATAPVQALAPVAPPTPSPSAAIVTPQTPPQPAGQQPLQPPVGAATTPGQQKIVGTPQPKKKQAPSTQDTLQIAEIRDGVVIMKDGSLRAVVMCQSINFDLMSPSEREAVEYSYQGFLNSTYFPIQILIRSQKVDLDSYLEKLDKVRTDQDNVLLGLLMEDYIAYVRYLLETANIMDKQFFVVVPYYPPLTSQEGIATGTRKLLSIFRSQKTVILNEADFTKHKTELAQRTQVVLNGMTQMGIRAVPLNTQELIELYYGFYNPDTAPQQNLTDVSEFDAPYVSKGDQPQPTSGGES